MVSSLRVTELRSGYGRREVLRRLSLEVDAGEILAVVGRNGAGKSTLLRTIFGMADLWEGVVEIDSVAVSPRPAAMLRAGVVYIPQASWLFPNMTVQECLRLTTSAHKRLGLDGASPEALVNGFPLLQDKLDRRCRTLSGGERQLLSLAMGLASTPKFLLLDEPSLGLSPGVAHSVHGEVLRLSRESRIGVLIVEQQVGEVLKVADRVAVLSRGTISAVAEAQEFKNEPEKLYELLIS